MKKSIILLALPALALTGCAKTITAAEAKEEAKKIAEHKMTQEELDAITAITVSFVMNSEESGKVDGATFSDKLEMEVQYEVSADKKFVHAKYAQKSESKEGDKDAEVSETFNESWTYVKDGALYVVTHSGESKKYYVVENDTVTSLFEKSLKSGVEQAVQAAAGTEYLGIFEESSSETAAEAGVKYEVKYASSGEGNLSVKGKAEYKDYAYPVGEGKVVKTSGSATLKYAWDKYLMSEVAATMDVHGEEGENSASVKTEAKGTVKYKAKVSYPSLDGFEKAASLSF